MNENFICSSGSLSDIGSKTDHDKRKYNKIFFLLEYDTKFIQAGALSKEVI